MALDPGTRLGPYEIVGALGAGGMGFLVHVRSGDVARVPITVVLNWTAGLKK